MKSLSDCALDESFGLLIQGPPKTGKTTLALQFPDPWIADCSNNLSGATRWFKKNMPAQIEQIRYSQPWLSNVIDPTHGQTIVPPEARWARLLTDINEALKDPTRKTIIIDDVGQVCEWLQAFIVSEKGTGKKEGMTISDWIPFRSLLAKLVTDLRLLCRNKRYLIFTAHEEYAKDERTGSIFTRVNIPSKLADNFGGLFSDVWRTIVEDVADVLYYKVVAQPTPAVPAIGNSLGLPANFKFTWKEFAPFLTSAK